MGAVEAEGGVVTLSSVPSASGQASFFPPGSIMMMGGNRGAPVGWLVCNGSVKSIEEFPRLYAAIGNRYNTGGEGAGNFRIPNVASQKRYMYGAPSVALPANVATGGSNTHVHTYTNAVNAAPGTDQAGTHSHQFTNFNVNAGGGQGSHNHGGWSWSSGGSSSTFTAGNGNVSGGTTGSHGHNVGGFTNNDAHANHNHNTNQANPSHTSNAIGNHAANHNTPISGNGAVNAESPQQSLGGFEAIMVIKT